MAQNATIQSLESPAPTLGNVVSAFTGDTVYTVSPSSGVVTKTSGTGYRLATGTTRVLVTVHCSQVGSCKNQNAYVQVGSIGSPTGRAGAVTNFTVHPVTAVLVGSPSGTNPMTFMIQPIGQDSTKSFYIGMDFPILGDNSGQPTGAASSSFYVATALANQTGNYDIDTGLATATVFRPITITMTSNLAFGAVSKPFAGNGLVSLDAATGEVTVSGQGVQEMPGIAAPASAAYTVNGEGGQAFSISVPPSFVMNGPGGTLTVTTTSTAGTIQSLSGALGSAGSFAFKVGGSFPITSATPTGAYSGTYNVVVNYN